MIPEMKERCCAVYESCISRIKMKLTTLDKICCFLSELCATFILMFLGCMGCINTLDFPNSNFQLNLNFGLVVLIAINAFGCVSYAHINPSVSLAAYIYGTIDLTMLIVYFVGQLLGAFIGYGVLKALVPTSAITAPGAAHALCVTAPAPQITTLQAVGIEFVITVILIAVCCAVWDPRNSKWNDSVPLRFGLIVSCIALTAGPFTGASMNPVRSLAPAIWNNDYDRHWIYWLSPLSASFITAFVYKAVFRRDLSESDKKLRAEELPLS